MNDIHYEYLLLTFLAQFALRSFLFTESKYKRRSIRGSSNIIHYQHQERSCHGTSSRNTHRLYEDWSPWRNDVLLRFIDPAILRSRISRRESCISGLPSRLEIIFCFDAVHLSFYIFLLQQSTPGFTGFVHSILLFLSD